MLDESKIRNVVFDVEQGLALAVQTGKGHGELALGAVLTADIFCLRKLDPEAAPASRRALPDRSTHRFNKTLGESESETRADHFTVFGAESIKWRKEPAALFRWDAGPFVNNRNAKAGAGMRCKIDNHAPGIAIVFY